MCTDRGYCDTSRKPRGIPESTSLPESKVCEVCQVQILGCGVTSIYHRHFLNMALESPESE